MQPKQAKARLDIDKLWEHRDVGTPRCGNAERWEHRDVGTQRCGNSGVRDEQTLPQRDLIPHMKA